MNKEHFKRLFERYVAGNCTDAERDEFFDLYALYRNDEQLHEFLDELYQQIRQDTQSSSYINYLGQLNAADNTPVVPISKAKTYRRIAAAAGLLLVISAAAWMWKGNARPTVTIADNAAKTTAVSLLAATTTIHTGTHERKVIVLSDSTRIVLNGATEIRYPDKFDDKCREIFLEGEAFFEVSNAAQWPFVIHAAGGIRTTVLGTSFNIKAYPDRKQTIVSVVTGKVKVSKNQRDLSTLVKGQEVRLSVNSSEIITRNITEAGIAAWQSGDIAFNDESMEDIVKDLQIFYGINITIKNKELANLLITTGFRKNTSVESALDNICELANAKYARNSNGYVVY
ncbi:FecR family protein [Chitinophaga sp. Cy-1792]|uniref:FecR family protein n=1 Tax=Chitinophaga sp. Cy-1792 TaxID=2608339 RepID=UPI00141EE6D0|nr:FecR domain-containing protein [Chitinophaga sp. Cy-1792]NIG55111.1 DUF4974 domain-containing protein [Chitinophaga sp. Cy-1792]